MKLNDIYTNLEEEINLKEKKNTDFKISKLKKNIDTFSKNLKQKIKLNKKKKKIIISKQKNTTDSILKKIKKDIDLKKSITNKFFYKKIFEKIKTFFYSFKENKNFKILKNNTSQKIKKNKINYKKIWIFISLFLLVNLIFVIFLTNKSIENLKGINSKNYVNKINTSYNLFRLSDFLSTPYYIIPEKHFQKLKIANKLWVYSTKLAKNLIEIYNQIKNKNNKIFISDILKNNEKIFLENKILTEKILKNLKNIKLKDKNFTLYKNIIKKLDILFWEYKNNKENLLSLIWDKKIKKYLILFQNNDELRATWWFPWSAWILSIYKWEIQNFEKKDIYAFEWDINKEYKNKLPAPFWLKKINPYFTLKDANYYSDYVQSATSINYFLQAWKYNYDWIIFINTNTVNKILKIIWPIYFDKIKTTINSKNFNEIFSVLVEAKVSKKWTLSTPKQILFDFSKKLEEKIINSKKILDILKIFFQELENRELAIIAFNKNENEILQKLWLNSKINFNSSKNFIFPVFTWLSENKSDRYLKIKYKIIDTLEEKQNNKCDIQTNLQIKLKHNFSQKDKKRILDYLNKFKIKNKQKILEIEGNWENRQYIRIILPKNSIIWKNNKKTKLIDFFTKLSVREEKTYNFSYKIKNIDCENYSFKLYKQPWIKKYDIDYIFIDKNHKKEEKLENLEKDFYFKIENF